MQPLFENWTQSKEVLLEGLTPSKRVIVDQLLENQKQHFLMETAAANQVSAASIADFQQKVMPIIRRVVPGTIATDLVGVQPMNGPVGLVYSMRFTFLEAADGNGDVSNDIAAGDEVFGNNSKMKRFYSTANVGTAGYPPALTAATTTGAAATTADYESFGGRSMGMKLLKQPVVAGSRKLQARWTPEAAHDASVQHGFDIESELTKAVSTQIAHEIDNEIINDLLGLAGTVGTYDFAATPAGFTPTYIGDRFAQLGVLINQLSSTIGSKTRVDAANWLVGSHLITTMLQSASKSVFAPAIQGTFDDAVGNKFVGTLNGKMKVFSYNWGVNDAWSFAAGNANTAMGATGEDILIGLKGSDELGAGYIYAPYVPLVSTGVVMDGQQFTPGFSLSTRYGKATFTNATTSLGNSADYYARLHVQNVSFS